MSRSFVRAMLIAVVAGGCVMDREADSRRSDTAEVHGIGVVCDSLDLYLEQLGFVPEVSGESDSCSVSGVLSLTEVALEVDPLEVLRDSLTGAGWTEAYEFAADGPGTGSFRVEHGDRLCRIEGGAPAWIDDDEEIRQSDEYSLNIVCRTGR